MDELVQRIPAPDDQHPAELHLGDLGWYLVLPDGTREDLAGIHPYWPDYEGDAIRAALDVLSDRKLWAGRTTDWLKPGGEPPPGFAATPSQARLLHGMH